VLRQLHKFRWTIVTEHYPARAEFVRANIDKQAGTDTRVLFGSGVYLDQPPFNLAVADTLLDIPFDFSTGDAQSRGHMRTILVCGSREIFTQGRFFSIQ
jgi:hypothetical protein